MCHGGRCFQPLFLLVQCTLLTQASHLSSQSTLSTDDHLDRMHEYVVDDHGKTSLLANSALMRRENLVAEPGSKQLTSRLKSFLRRKIEERSRARRLLAEANSPYQPSCAKLPNFKLKGSTPMLYNAGNTVAACIAGCRPRQNVAKGKTASGSRNTRGNGPARALDPKGGGGGSDGNAKTQFVSARMSDPYWQVDLGEERDVGEVYLSSSVTMAGVSVGLRDAACVEATTTTTTAPGSMGGELSDSNNIRALSPKKLGACDFKHTCGTISGSGKFVSCKGQSGRYLVIKKTGERQTLTVGEDAVLSRTAAVATMSVAKKGESNGADRVLDDADNTATISQAGNNPHDLLFPKQPPEEGNVGKVTITPNAGARSAFAPTAAAPVKVGVSDKTCSNGEKGYSSSEKSVLCGTLTETKEAGSYIVDCGGKGGKFAWIELPGKSRAINIATVEVEQAALCEQVVFERPAKGAVKFDGTPEEKKAVMGLLAEMGYAVEGGGIPQLQKDVQELSPEAFMEAIPKGTDFRTRANLSRFVKDLMLGETDPPPVGLSDPVDTIAEKDERFHIILHNILKADENERKLTIRVIHLSRFVDYTLQSRHHAKLFLPEGSSLQLICEMFENVSFHRVFSAKDLSVVKGSMLLFHSYMYRSMAAFAATLRPPLAPVQPTACVYHFCGPDADPEQGVLKENNLTKLEQYNSMALLPVERAQLHIESNYRKYHNRGHAIIVPEDCSESKQLSTAQHAGRHVYISQIQEHLWADAGALVNEPQKFDASADLADVQEVEDGVHKGLCIRLHNVPAKNLKFGLKVKVKLPDDRLAHFQLDSRCCGVLRLPEGSSVEVESQSEEFPESKASITLDPKALAKANGGNVYFYSAHDRQSWSEEEP
eukprot:s21_g11.t1